MTSDRILAAFVAALALNELVHIVFEVWGIRQKVQWLSARIDKRPHGSWPIHIDTLIKTISLHIVLFVVFVSVFFVVFMLLGLSIAVLLQLTIMILIFCYAYTTLGMDAYHSEIGQLLKRYKRHHK